MSHDAASLRRILTRDRTVAVVGLSDQWHRPSHFAAAYMQAKGYRIVPVNPRCTEILGEPCYPRLEDIPFAVDMVDVFRKPEDVPDIARSAVAIGARKEPPSPTPRAKGSMPMIIAEAVISTGRIRVEPASSAADNGGTPARNRCNANDTTRILLAVATPMVMMAPVSAGTDKCVPDKKSIHAMPANAAGSALIMISGSSQLWKFTTISRYTKMIAPASPSSRPL